MRRWLTTFRVPLPPGGARSQGCQTMRARYICGRNENERSRDAAWFVSGNEMVQVGKRLKYRVWGFWIHLIFHSKIRARKIDTHLVVKPSNWQPTARAANIARRLDSTQHPYLPSAAAAETEAQCSIFKPTGRVALWRHCATSRHAQTPSQRHMTEWEVENE